MAGTETLELTLDDVCQLEFHLADRHRRLSEEMAALVKEVEAHKDHPSANFIKRTAEYATETYKGQQEDIELQLYYLRNLFKDKPRDLRPILK